MCVNVCVCMYKKCLHVYENCMRVQEMYICVDMRVSLAGCAYCMLSAHVCVSVCVCVYQNCLHVYENCMCL